MIVFSHRDSCAALDCLAVLMATACALLRKLYSARLRSARMTASECCRQPSSAHGPTSTRAHTLDSYPSQSQTGNPPAMDPPTIHLRGASPHLATQQLPHPISAQCITAVLGDGLVCNKPAAICPGRIVMHIHTLPILDGSSQLGSCAALFTPPAEAQGLRCLQKSGACHHRGATGWSPGTPQPCSVPLRSSRSRP